MSLQLPPLSERGFTLIEVLLATTLVAVIATMVFGSLQLSTVAIERARDTAFHDQVMRRTLRIMMEELTAGLSSNTAPWIGVDGQRDGRPSDTIAFLTLGKFPVMESGRETEHVRIVYTREDNRLLRYARKNLYGLTDDSVEQLELATNVKGFNLRYFDGLGNIWSDQWDGRARSSPPAAVLIELTISQNDSDSATIRQWVPIGVRS